MKLFVIAEGRIKEREMRAVANDYLGRLSRYVKCDEIETKDAAGLAKAIPDGAFVKRLAARIGAIIVDDAGLA